MRDELREIVRELGLELVGVGVGVEDDSARRDVEIATVALDAADPEPDSPHRERLQEQRKQMGHQGTIETISIA